METKADQTIEEFAVEVLHNLLISAAQEIAFRVDTTMKTEGYWEQLAAYQTIGITSPVDLSRLHIAAKEVANG